MICPKCGFDQPDDVYCAFCGIDIKKYKREKRKKQHITYVLMAFIAVAGVFVVINAIHQVKTPELPTPYAEKKEEVQTRGVSLPEVRRKTYDVKTRPRPPRRTDRQLPRISKTEESLGPEGLEAMGSRGDEPPGRQPLPEEKAAPPDKPAGKAYTATEWFEKGRALDDESDAEVECYNKALEVDPEYAPAHFRLGAIHYRRANYELADREFGEFIKYASEADEQTYDIYVYYSPSDVERLLAIEAMKKEAAEKEEASVEAEGAAKETSTEVAETTRETPVEAEEEVPAEAEQVEGEASEEGEEAEGEALVEAEEIEEQVSAEAEEAEEMETEASGEIEETEGEVPGEVENEIAVEAE